jgi:hypothetical protein
VALTRKYTEPNRVAFKLRYFLSSRNDRLALVERRALARLELPVANFIVHCSQFSIEEFHASAGASLLKKICKHVLPVIAAGGKTGAAARARANTYEDTVGGDIIKPAKAILMEVMGSCLATLDQTELSQLYKDLASPNDVAASSEPAPCSRTIRGLVPHLRDKKLHDVAAGILDILEHTLTQELATRLATRPKTPLIEELIDAAELKSAPLAAIRQTLEELRAIGEWLSSPSRPDTEVLNMILETVDDETLGKLVAQAWPERAAHDRYGAEPAAMDAAKKFAEECDGHALQTWHDALATQLRRRNRTDAARAAESVLPNGEEPRARLNISAAARAVLHRLDQSARVRAGAPHNWNDLRTGLRNQTLAWMLRVMPPDLRIAMLRTLSPDDLSALRAVLEAPAESAHVKPMVAPDIEKVQNDELHARQSRVEDILASLHEALAGQDRPAALVKLGMLGRAVAHLEAFHKACGIAMPDVLGRSLTNAVARMRALLCGEESDAVPLRVLGELSDLELGQLRAASASLAPFGLLADKSELKSEIRTRSALPGDADAAMDQLLECLTDTRATLRDIVSGLRDVAGILVRHNMRRAALGEQGSADDNDSLAYDTVQRALTRYTQLNAGGQAHLRQALARYPDITGGALVGRLLSLAQASASFPPEHTERLNTLLSVLGMAGRVEGHLYAACMGDAMPEDGSAAPAGTYDEGHAGSRDLDAALAGEFGVEWDETSGLYFPIVTAARHLRFAQHLSARLDADGSRLRSVGLRTGDGNVSWFLASRAFAADVLPQPGISLAVKGVSARGRQVEYPGFDPALDGAERQAAVAQALQALQDLAGSDAPALTAWIHHGVVDAFSTALSWPQHGSPLKLPNGDRVLALHAPQDMAEFRIERQPEGNYLIETTLLYTAIGKALGRNSLTGESEPVALDPARSRLSAAFCLATDSMNTPPRLEGAVDIRYRLALPGAIAQAEG